MTLELKNKSLDDLRQIIDQLDDQLLQILANRRQVSSEIARTKGSMSKPVRDLKREKLMLEKKLAKAASYGLDGPYVGRLYKIIINDSLEQQYHLQKSDENCVKTIAYLGHKGSYSQFAADEYCSRNRLSARQVGCETMSQVVGAVTENQAEIAILPLENTTTGTINEALDLILNSGVHVVGEEILSIQHCLIGLPGSDLSNIKTILAHPQPIAQCAEFISAHPQWNVEYTDSTTSGIKLMMAANNKEIAVIGSLQNTIEHELELLSTDINNQSENSTRFLVLANAPVTVAGDLPSKTSVIFSTTQKAGALVDVLSTFKSHDVVLSKLQSRPIQDKPWEETFYIDIVGSTENEHIKQAIAEAASHCCFLKVLGSYPTCDLQDIPLPSATDIQQQKPSVQSADKTETATQQPTVPSTKIKIGSHWINDGSFTWIAGPRVISSSHQILACAEHLKAAGGHILLGESAEKWGQPSTASAADIEHWKQVAGEKYHLAVANEVSTLDDLSRLRKSSELLIIDANQMMNHQLLKAAGRVNLPILLKRGHMSTVDEWLAAANSITEEGNQQVILCESGIRTFQQNTSYMLDLNAIHSVRNKSHLPIIIDPSGCVENVEQLKALVIAARTVGANGALVYFDVEGSQGKNWQMGKEELNCLLSKE